MRVLLADPPQVFLEGTGHTRFVQPLGLAYVASALKVRHDVRMLLPDTRPYRGETPWAVLRDVLVQEHPQVLGLTSVTATFPAAIRLAAEAKSVIPNLITVLGGTHASADPLGCLDHNSPIDFVVSGEGEQTMLELVDSLEQQHGSIDANRIPGLFWRDHATGAIRRSAQRDPILNLDSVAFPDRKSLVWDTDIHPAFYQGIITLRGCPYKCIYCAVPSSESKRTRFRSAVNVVDEIEHLIEQHNVPGLFFHDSVFTLNKRRTRELCELMVTRDVRLPFNCQTRTDRIDEPMLDLLQAAGCHQIFFGIESGDVDSLAKIRKRTELSDIIKAVDMVRARNIACTGFFMVGYPWEDEALINKTVDFATSINLDAVSLFSATPLPGTALWDMSNTQKLPASIDFTTPQVNLTRLPDQEYARVFASAKQRIHRYNIQAMGGAARSAGRRGPAVVNWLQADQTR